MHWYMQCLVYGTNIAKELALDNVGVINTELITLDEFGAAKLPDDYVDWTKIGLAVGQYIRPLISENGINRLPKLDSNGNQELYNNVTAPIQSGYLPYTYYQQVVFNSYGEYIGREFGSANYNYNDNYKILKERGIIQCSEALAGQQIVFEYISNGCCTIGTVGVEPYSEATIRDYIKWQLKEHNRNMGLGERADAKNEYIKQHKKLIARKSKLTADEINRIFIENFHAGA